MASIFESDHCTGAIESEMLARCMLGQIGKLNNDPNINISKIACSLCMHVRSADSSGGGGGRQESERQGIQRFMLHKYGVDCNIMDTQARLAIYREDISTCSRGHQSRTLAHHLW